MPMPQSVEASTQKPMGDGGGGRDKVKPQNSFESWRCHHAMSLKAVLGGDFRVKFERAPLKEAAKRDKEGRQDRPSGMASEQWTRVLRMDSASFRMNFAPSIQGDSLSRYLAFFLSGICMHLVMRSQRKPR